MTRTLPGGARLVYNVAQPIAGVDPRAIDVYADTGSGVHWEFTITEYDFGDHGRHLKFEIFANQVRVLREIPDFFAAIEANQRTHTLADALDVLAAIGATPADQSAPARRHA